MFADHVKLLSELIIEFPVTHQDLMILVQNKSTYHKWLEMYTGEGTRKGLEEDQSCSRVIDKIGAWISIGTHGYAAQNIRISGYQDVYVDFADGIHSGDFFLSLCFQHMKNAAWLFTEDKLHRVEEHTRGFVSRVNKALRRMMKDWTPTVSVYLECSATALALVLCTSVWHSALWVGTTV